MRYTMLLVGRVMWLIAFGFLLGMIARGPVEADAQLDSLTCTGTASGTSIERVLAELYHSEGQRFNIELDVRLRCR